MPSWRFANGDSLFLCGQFLGMYGRGAKAWDESKDSIISAHRQECLAYLQGKHGMSRKEAFAEYELYMGPTDDKTPEELADAIAANKTSEDKKMKRP
jgi:hypothetical protein